MNDLTFFQDPIFYFNVLLIAIVAALFCLRHTNIACLFLFLIMPISRDGPLNLNLAPIKLVLAAILFFFALPRTSRLFRSETFHRACFLLILLTSTVIVSFALSEAKRYSFNFVFYFSTSVFMFFMFAKLLDFSFLKQAAGALLIVTYVACGLAILQFFVIKFQLSSNVLLRLIPIEFRMAGVNVQHQICNEGLRLPSFFYHNNGFGHFLTVVFGFHFSMLLYSKKTLDKILYTSAVSLILVACLLTLSRGTALVIAIEILLIVILLRRLVKTKVFQLLFYAISIFTFGLLFLETNTSKFFERIISSGLSYRDINWNYAIRLIPDHFLFGSGPGTSSYYILTSFPFISEYLKEILSDLNVIGVIDWHMSHPHNFYLNAILEAGVFSLVVYLLLFCTLIGKGLNLNSNSNHSLIKALSAGATVPLIGCLLRGFFESYVLFDSPDVGFIVAFFSVLILYLNSFPESSSKRLSPNLDPKSFENLQNLNKKV